MGPGGGASWSAMRSFTRDSSVASSKLAPGTVKRIVRFAAPYRGQLMAFLFVIVIDALVGIAPPLVLKRRSSTTASAPTRLRPVGPVWFSRWRCSSPGSRCSTPCCRSSTGGTRRGSAKG